VVVISQGYSFLLTYIWFACDREFDHKQFVLVWSHYLQLYIVTYRNSKRCRFSHEIHFVHQLWGLAHALCIT